MRFSRDCLSARERRARSSCPPQDLSIKGRPRCAAARWGRPGMLRRENPYFSAAMLHRTGVLAVLRRWEARGARRVDVLGRTQHDGALIAARLAQIANEPQAPLSVQILASTKYRPWRPAPQSVSICDRGHTTLPAPRPVDVWISAEPRESDPFGVLASRESRHDHAIHPLEARVAAAALVLGLSRRWSENFVYAACLRPRVADR
jgi:hypothetical protein